MKKAFFLTMLALTACLVSCNKQEGPQVSSSRTARVSIKISGCQLSPTKALPVAANEALVNTVDAFVFNSTGDLDAYGHYTSADFTTTDGVTTLKDGKELECTTGAGKVVYVLINGNDSNLATGEIAFANISSEAQLKARIFKLEDNKAGSPATLNNFQMIGKTANQTFSAGDNDVSVQVIRSVARIVIKKITKNFSNEGLAAGNLIVKNIYMSNVVGRYGYGNIVDNDYKLDNTSIAAAYPAANWLNKYDPTADPADVDIQSTYDLWLNRGIVSPYVTFGSNTSAAVSKTTEVESTFYVMPNDVPWGTGTPAAFGPVAGDTWSARHTKLVIETEYDGKTYYYVIPIAGNGSGASYVKLGSDEDDGSLYSGIKANYSYEINELELTRLGSTNPDEPVVAANVNFNITVKPWDFILLGEDGKYII